MRFLKYYLIAALVIGGFSISYAHIGPVKDGEKPTSGQSATPPNQVNFRADCAQATQQIDQDINNVRARLLTGGDVWWNTDDGRYVVPKVDPSTGALEVSSLFAGAVWLGGIDPGQNLKVACQTYGSANGLTDFWPGPLTDIGIVDPDTCANWDRFFKILGTEIDDHLRNYEAAVKAGVPYSPDDVPRNIKLWPARGNEFFFEEAGFELPNTIQGLAAFFDRGGDGNFDPTEGDYPRIEIRGCDVPQYPDEMIFWIYNDNGGIHTQSRGDAIQMEIQVQTFAYATNDEINDMTFQRYKLINRAIESIDSTFFAMWVDPDLGCYTDDYVGCDTTRSLAFTYNQDALDGESSASDCNGVATYGTEIPIIGTDYFRGPLDENGDQIGMSSFTYANNGGLNPPPGTEDPGQVAQEYYNYLSGSWRDGTRFTLGGNGYDLNSIEFVNYAFVDPPNNDAGWSMCSGNLPAGDRRTIQASGPFKLDPGAVNELIIGAVWVPDLDYPCPDISPLLAADDLAQGLFDACFDIVDGPDAPDVDWVELDKELVAVFSNDEVTSNNAFEAYEELDIVAPGTIPEEERKYRFEGYKVYQLVGPNVTVGELDNPDKSRIISIVDLDNDILDVYNWGPVQNPTVDPNIPDLIWVPTLQTDGATDNGLRHTFRITEDQFAEGDRRLVNHKKYYYTVISYAYNNYEDFKQIGDRVEGQRTPYIEGRRNIQTYTAIPRPITDLKLNSSYGDGPVITRLDGQGAGGNFLRISDETREAILNGTTNGQIEYLAGSGPITVNIYNPLEAVNGQYQLSFFDSDGNDATLDAATRWRLTKVGTSEVIESETTIERFNEQIIAEYGFSIDIVQSAEPGTQATSSNGAIGLDIVYADATQDPWLTAQPDTDGGQNDPFNFVKTGPGQVDNNLDPNQSLSTIGGGGLVPYILCDFTAASNTVPYITPAWMNSLNSVVRTQNRLENLNNVDIVFTSDKSKWSRWVVVETASVFYYDANLGLAIPTEGGATNYDLRAGASVGKEDADGDGLADPDGDGTGMGWFPGYAVDVETGKRLNIFFGENSTYDGTLFANAYDGTPTGRDMMWNPSSQTFLNTGVNPAPIFSFINGGQHFIYVTKQEYDECAVLRQRLSGPAAFKRFALNEVEWTGMPVVATGSTLNSYADGLIPNDVTVSVRVDNAYNISEGTNSNVAHPEYLFDFDNVAPEILTTEIEVNAQLDAINVVPNPYYGFSDYETSQFSNIVKITNLPARCLVTIYTLDGKFIRQYNRNETEFVETNDRNNPGVVSSQITPAVEWDLENSKGIPVASGVYLIHVDAYELGERVIKWFGVSRQFDPSGL